MSFILRLCQYTICFGSAEPKQIVYWYNLRVNDIVCQVKINKYIYTGPRWRSWLRHCATNRKVAGSMVSVGFFIGIIYGTMALGSIHPLTEMSTRNISWWVNAAVAYGWQPATFMCRLSRNLGASTSWNPAGLSRLVMGLLYLFTYVYRGVSDCVYHYWHSVVRLCSEYCCFVSFQLVSYSPWIALILLCT
jgi:hypothetical protein